MLLQYSRLNLCKIYSAGCEFAGYKPGLYLHIMFWLHHSKKTQKCGVHDWISFLNFLNTQCCILLIKKRTRQLLEETELSWKQNKLHVQFWCNHMNSGLLCILLAGKKIMNRTQIFMKAYGSYKTSISFCLVQFNWEQYYKSWKFWYKGEFQTIYIWLSNSALKTVFWTQRSE